MSIFRSSEDIIKQARREYRSRAGGAFIGALGAIFFTGWILFLTYNAFRPDAWPYLGLWTAFGASYLFQYVVGKLRGEA